MIDLNALDNDPWPTIPVKKKDLRALAAALEGMERELAEERHSREVAAKHAWRFSDALHKIKDMKPDPEFGMVPIDTAREVARRALEGKE